MKNKQIKSIIAYYDRESPAAIEMRRLYSNMMHTSSRENGGLKSVMITSATLGEGKSTLASLLAITVAEYTGRKVLLVDSDIRRPKIHELFNIPIMGGFFDILSTNLPVKNSLKDTPFENLKIITAGKRLTGTSGLLKPDKMRAFLDEIKFYFDLIILDCAPIVPVTDVMDISPDIDGVLLVIKAGQTQKEVTKRAANLLNNSGVNILGVILNDVGRVLPYYYNYDYYRYSPAPTEKRNRVRKNKRSK